jgi:hypothetical protein
VDIFYLAVRGRQTKSSLWCQNLHSSQCHGYKHNPNWFPKACLPQAGMSLVIQSPLTIGLQTQKSLCDLCGFAVNLDSDGANSNPKIQ